MPKKSALFALLWCAALLFGAPDPAWLIAETDKKDTSFDVFYLHPTLLSDKRNPYPDFGNPKVRARLADFSAAQTALFGGKARIFVPAVRQLEFKRCLQEMKRTSSPRIPEDSQRFAAVLDAVAAFRHYLARWNGGRPYILLGHSQGAADLYEVLCRVPEISPDRGFAAAYLPGLAGLTEEQMKKDLAGRGILPARDEGSPGVVVIWNTRLPGGEKDPFTVPGSYGIDPVNWRRDGFPAPKSLHRGMILFDHRTCGHAPALPATDPKLVCSAALDENGSLIVRDVPEAAKKLYAGFLTPECCHAGDVWMFAGNIAENAALRAALCRMKSELDRARTLIRTGKAECVVLRDGRVARVESGRGVSPLLRLYDGDREALRGGILVDKVIGRAAAAIAIQGGAKFVHGEIMSEDAQRFLKENGIPGSCGLFVKRILNQRRNGLCPLEKSVEGISDPAEALSSLRRRVAELQKMSKR